MRKNVREVWEAYTQGKACRKHRSIWADGLGRIGSYDTVLVVPDLHRHTWVFNRTQYSATTSSHQRALWALYWGYADRPVVTVTDAPRGVTSTELVELARRAGEVAS